MILDTATLLLYALLIITGITIFLFILSLLLLRDLSERIRETGGVSSGRYNMPAEQSRGSKPGKDVKVVSEKGKDIASGIENIAGKYRLDSLIVASRDGLVVAFTGSSNPEFEAAYYTDMFARKNVAPGDGLSLFEVRFGNTPLVGIARGKVSLPDESKTFLAADIESALREHLGQPAPVG